MRYGLRVCHATGHDRAPIVWRPLEQVARKDDAWLQIKRGLLHVDSRIYEQ
jgi:hypothetical protein